MMKNVSRIFVGGIAIRQTSSLVSCDGNTKAKKPSFDCENPTCKSKSDLILAALTKKQNLVSNDNAVYPKIAKDTKKTLQCPVNKEELGKSTWILMHTMAAYFPEEPDEMDKTSAIHFFTSLAALYPCPVCAADFQESIKRSPPK